MADPWEIDDTATQPWEVDDTAPGGLKRTLSKRAQAYGGTKEPSVFKQAIGGAKHAWDRAAYGLADIVGQGSPENEEQLAQGRAFVNETGPASTAGAIGGDMVMLAGPAVRLTRAVAGLGKYAPMLADMVLSAGHGAVTAPTGQRTSGALSGAVGSGVGSAVGTVAARALAPAGRLGRDAQYLIDEGIPLTPGQAKPDSLIGGLEPWLAKVPLIGGPVRARQKDAADATLGALAKNLGVPKAALDGASPQEIVELLGRQVDTAYTNAASRAVGLNKNFRFDLMRAAGQLQNLQGVPFGVSKDAMREMLLATRLIKNAKTPAEAARAWKNMDSWLGRQGAELAPLQETWRAAFHRVAPKDASKDLLDADLLSRQVRALERGVGTKSAVTPEQLARGLRATDIDPQQVTSNAAKYIPGGDAAVLGGRAAKVNDLADASTRLTARQQSPWVIPQATAALGIGGYYGGMSAVPAIAGTGALATMLAYTKGGQKWGTSQIPALLRASEVMDTGAGKQVLRRLGAAGQTQNVSTTAAEYEELLRKLEEEQNAP